MIPPESFIRYESGAFDEEKRTRFEAALAADEEALRYWLAQRQMDEALRAAHGTAESRTRLRQSILAVVTAADRVKVKQNILRPTAGRMIRERALLGLATLAAAACVLLMVWIAPGRNIARVLAATNGGIERAGTKRPAAKGMALRVSDQLVVGEPVGAAMTLEYRDGTLLILQSGSRLTLGQDEHRGKQLTLAQGSLTARVSKQPAGAPMILRTPEAILTVVGTEFALAADDAQTNLRVKDGLVRMARPDGSNAVNVAAGQSMVFLPDSIHPPAPLPGSTLGQAVNAKSGRRSGFLWPFASESLWNRALGSGAQYTAVNPAYWEAHATRSDMVTGRPIFMEVLNFPVHRVLIDGKQAGQVRLPDKFRPGFAAHWPVIVMVDPYASRVMELRHADRLPDGDLSAQAFSLTSLDGPGDRGLTASGISALGGVIRFGELTRGIPHALAMGVSKETLGGNVQFGSWLAIPPSVDLSQFQGVELEVARALQDYGAYVVDTSDAPFTFYVWYENTPPDFSQIVTRLVPMLQVVTQREAGTPRRQSAPPIEHAK